MPRQKKRCRWTAEEISALMDMRNNQGFTFTEIAEELNRTEIAISARYSIEKRRRFKEQREKRKSAPAVLKLRGDQFSKPEPRTRPAQNAHQKYLKEIDRLKEMPDQSVAIEEINNSPESPLWKKNVLSHVVKSRYLATLEDNGDVIIWDSLAQPFMPFAVLAGSNYDNKKNGYEDGDIAPNQPSVDRVVSCLNAMDGVNLPESEICEMLNAQNKLAIARRHTVSFMHGLLDQLNTLESYIVSNASVDKLMNVLDVKKENPLNLKNLFKDIYK